MRYRGPKVRLCRREGVNLFGSAKYAKCLERNSNIPGIHGMARQGKVSDYGKQLREKQKAKRMYGLSEKQFKACVLKAITGKMVTGNAIFLSLETRLDNLVYRSGLAMTRMQARQFVGHGLFTLNGKKATIPSMKIKAGDIVEVKENKESSPVFAKNNEEMEKYDAPSWLKVDTKKLSIEILELPSPEHFENLIEPRLVIEFYSR